MKYKIVSTILFVSFMGYFALKSHKLGIKNEIFIDHVNSLSTETVKEIQLVRKSYDYESNKKSLAPLVSINNVTKVKKIVGFMKNNPTYSPDHRIADDSLIMLFIDNEDKILLYSYLGTYDDKEFIAYHYYFEHSDTFNSEELYKYFNEIGVLDGYNFKY